MNRVMRLIVDLEVWWMLFKFRVWGLWTVLGMRIAFAMRRDI